MIHTTKLLLSCLLTTISLSVYSLGNDLGDINTHGSDNSERIYLYDDHLLMTYALCKEAGFNEDVGIFLDAYDRDDYKLLTSIKIKSCLDGHFSALTKIDGFYYFSIIRKNDNMIVLDEKDFEIKRKHTIQEGLYISDGKHLISGSNRKFTFYDPESFEVLKTIQMPLRFTTNFNEKNVKKLIALGIYKPYGNQPVKDNVDVASLSPEELIEYIKSMSRGLNKILSKENWIATWITDQELILKKPGDYRYSFTYNVKNKSLVPLDLEYKESIFSIAIFNKAKKYLVSTYDESCLRHHIQDFGSKFGVPLLELPILSRHKDNDTTDGKMISNTIIYKDYAIMGVERDLYILNPISNRIKVISNATTEESDFNGMGVDNNHIRTIYQDEEKGRLLALSYTGNSNRWFDLNELISGNFTEDITNKSVCEIND